jgi:hypothetical protein
MWLSPVSDKARSRIYWRCCNRRETNTVTIFLPEEAISWIKKHKKDPFFLYLPLTIPHANNEGTRMFGDGAEVPDYGIYEKKNWSKQDKGASRYDLTDGS